MTIRALQNFHRDLGFRVGCGAYSASRRRPRGTGHTKLIFAERSRRGRIGKIFQTILSRFALLLCTFAILGSVTYAQDPQRGKSSANDDRPVARNGEVSQEVSSKATSGQDTAASSGVSSTIAISKAGTQGKEGISALPDGPRKRSKAERLVKLQTSIRSGFNNEIYCRNKLEFALDGGWFPINIPFPFNVFEGDPYELYPLRYTLVPIVVSIRWHLDGIGSRWIFRGNWDMTASFSATAIPRGPESHYFSYDMGLRRNFVPRNSKIAPYTDLRLGVGMIDAKGPLGVYYAQGQNYTFTANLGAGVRYNFNSRYGISGGLNWMHISNNNLSSPEYSNYGINVYGPQFGLNIRLRGGRRMHSE